MYLHTAILHTAHCTALLGSAWIAPRAGRHAGSFFTGPWKLNFAPASHRPSCGSTGSVGGRTVEPASALAGSHCHCIIHASFTSRHTPTTTSKPLSHPPLYRSSLATLPHQPTYTPTHPYTHTHAPTSPADTPDLTHSRRSMWPP